MGGGSERKHIGWRRWILEANAPDQRHMTSRQKVGEKREGFVFHQGAKWRSSGNGREGKNERFLDRTHRELMGNNLKKESS